MPGSSPHGLTAPEHISRRAHDTANGYGDRSSTPTGLGLRIPSHQPQPYYTPGQDGARPSLHHSNRSYGSPRHDAFADNDGPASSPPPDEANVFFQPEGITTAAAYNSPLLYTTKAAQKRFKASTLYGETDHSDYIQEGEVTPTVASRPTFQPYKSSSSARIRLVPQAKGLTYTAAPASAYSQDSYSKSSRGFIVYILQLLPVRIQRVFKRKRKKSLSSDIRAGTSIPIPAQRSRLRLVLVACLTVVAVIYLVGRRKGTSLATSSLSELEASIPSEVPISVVIPTRKWWQVSHETTQSRPQKVKKKASSFAKPYHSFDELMALSSKNALLVPPQEGTPENLPSVTIIVDCLQFPYSFSEAHMEAMNSLLVTLSTESIQPAGIRILISPDDYPRTNRGLFGHNTGKVSLYTISASMHQHYLTTPAFANIDSEYVLLLCCPKARGDRLRRTSNTNYLSNLLHVTGTEEYSSKALTSSGVATRPHPGSENRRAIAYGSQSLTVGDGDTGENKYRQLRESRPVDFAFGDLLMRSTWLDVLKTESDVASAQDTGAQSHGVIASLGRKLGKQLQVQTWALPLDAPEAYTSQTLPYDLLDFIRGHPEEFEAVEEDELNVKGPGSPAKLAVMISKNDHPYTSLWETIVCAFADDTIYGHEVRLFASYDAMDVQDYVSSCPEVEIHTLNIEAVQAWSPDICLTTSEAQSDIAAASLGCFRINVPGEDLAHLDWLVALPLESLLNWNVPKIDLAIATNNRPVSLHRLLTSIRSAHYLGDKVNLVLNLEQTTDDATRIMLEGSFWPFGDISMRNRIVMGGLLTSIVESWYPANNDTYGVLLEDDVEVSSLFYSWLKFTILYYRYGTEAMRKQSERLYGVSLYQPKNIELRPEGRRKFDAHKLLEDAGIPSTLPYLSQVPCSWGAAYFPEHWKEFHQFLTIRLSEAALDLSDPIVPNIRSNRWPNSWKRYLIELVYLRGYSMLYPNYADFRSLSTNHLEQGTHVKAEVQAQKRRDLFEVPLLMEQDNLIDELPDGTLPSWSSLPILDFWGSFVNEKEIIDRGQITFDELELCPTQGGHGTEMVEAGSQTASHELDHDASKLLCTGPMDVQDWKEWRMRMRHGANEIDARMLLDREARLDEREKRIAELELQLMGADVRDGP